MKYQYIIQIGEKKTEEEEYYITFPYRATKEIQLTISSEFAEVNTLCSKLYNLESKDYIYGLIKESLRRIYSAYILLYEKAPKYKRITYMVKDSKGNTVHQKDISSLFTIYSLAEGKTIRPISSQLKDKGILQTVFGGYKKDVGSKSAALTAYLYSKYFLFETERFMYLWMSFNGMYTSLCDNNDKRLKEFQKIERIIEEYSTGGALIDKSLRESKEGEIKLLFSSTDANSICNDIHDKTSEFYKSVVSFLNENQEQKPIMDPLGFVVGSVAYMYRNNMFHAGKPILLVAFEDDLDFKVLQCVNTVLEDFIDKCISEILLK